MTMIAVTIHAVVASVVELAKRPIFNLLLVNHTSGTTANESCRDKIPRSLEHSRGKWSWKDS